MKTVLFLTALALASATTIAMAADGNAPRGFERLRAADANGDGMLSREEAAALPRIAKHFDAIDANHDNLVTFDELRAAHRAHRGGMAKAVFHKVDADGDGRISKAEALAAAATRFDRVDANHDGFVTPEEAQAAHRGHRGR